MPKVTPFKAIRPNKECAEKFCALPYDVYNRKEAKVIVENNPLSFLGIDRAETSFDDSVDTYDPKVYVKAKELLEGRIQDGTLIQDGVSSYYIYELTMDGRSQTGIVACSAVDDYLSSAIRKHENTREEKEIDRINHVDTTNAHTGPIFLIYRSNSYLKEIVEKTKKEKTPIYDFVSEDGIGHRAFIIDDPSIVKDIEGIFADIPCTYIADGHHRCASAVKVGIKRRGNSAFTGEEGFNRFLSVLFPDDELMIMPYNRVIKDLNGYTEEEFINKIKERGFAVEAVGENEFTENGAGFYPNVKGEFGMYLGKKWYKLTAGDAIESEDPVKGLDVSILQDYLFDPVLGIKDPRIDKRIDFVGGIRGLKELTKRCDEDMVVAFSMFPTSIAELLDVADAGLLMPPKSTWFEPKLRSGMFIHSLDD